MSNHCEPSLANLAQARRTGTLDRRAFLALSTSFAACARPFHATAQPASGGSLRIAAHVPPIRDPRLFDRIEAGNIARQFCEPLVRWDAETGFTPHLLSGWQLDAEARRTEMATLQPLLRDSGVIIQPVWRTTALHHTPGVQGLAVHPADELRLDTVQLSA